MRTTLRLTALCSAFTVWIALTTSAVLASCDESASDGCSDSVANVWAIYAYMGIVALIGIAIWAAVGAVRKPRDS